MTLEHFIKDRCCACPYNLKYEGKRYKYPCESMRCECETMMKEKYKEMYNKED